MDRLVTQSYYSAGETEENDTHQYISSATPIMKQECQLYLTLIFGDRKVSLRWVWRRSCKDRRWIELAHGHVKMRASYE